MKRTLSLRALLILTIFTIAVILFSHTAVYAAKKRVRTVKTAHTIVAYSQAKLSRATNSIIVNFTNLESVMRINYELTYDANGISQGVTGSIVPAGATDSRDLYFGTCSKGVCTPHTNIQNAQLLVQTKLSSGQTYSKRYIIRI